MLIFIRADFGFVCVVVVVGGAGFAVDSGDDSGR